jgi:hypothetical protein
MAVKETAAQKRSRIEMLLAEYDAKNRELNKLTASVKALKAQIKEIPVGTYNSATLGTGTPREMLNQREAKDLLTKAGIPIPMITTEAPITVTLAPK